MVEDGPNGVSIYSDPVPENMSLYLRIEAPSNILWFKIHSSQLKSGSLDLTLSLRALTSASARNSLITKGFFLNGFHALNGTLAFDFEFNNKEGKEYGVS